LWFQSPAGIRLLSNNGGLDSQAGLDVDPLTTNAKFSSAVVVPQYTQVRWYSRDSAQPTIVLDYSSNSWSTWTGLTCVGGVFWPVTNLAVIANGAGSVWVETVGTFTDAGTPYESIVRTAWLRAKSLGDFQRVRRAALFGNSASPLSLRTRVYYDERPFHDEELIREYPLGTGNDADGVDPLSTFNTSVWGAGDNPPFNTPVWGLFSVWGDSLNQLPQGQATGLTFRDGVFKFRWRPGRQKCSVISFEFSDMGATNSGFEPVVLALELGVKSGLDRIPT